MVDLVSPGLQIREIDQTTAVPAVSTTIGALAGAFNWGPVEEIINIGSERELVSVFGEPDSDTAPYFFSATQFLQYGNALKVVRADSADLLNAEYIDGSAESGVKVKNASDFEANKASFATGNKRVIAKYPGTLGNSLKVDVCPASSTVFGAWGFRGSFDDTPGTSPYARRVIGGSAAINDEIHIVVSDSDGGITGNKGEVLESFAFVSQASDAKNDDGSTNYYVDVVNSQSQYIWIGQKPASAYTDLGTPAVGFSGSFGGTTLVEMSMSAGADDNDPTQAEIKNAYDMFADRETEDISLIVGGPSPSSTADATSHCNALIAIAQSRGDCIACVSPTVSATANAASSAATTAVKTWADSLTSSSYGVLDSGALYIYDKYNDEYRYIPANGAVAGLCANTDRVADPWYSPAGFDRGQILGITRLAWNPKQADRDTLYKARVNPLVSFPGQGTVLFGDKTALSRPSAFDRINVRRLFIVLRKSIAIAARSNLFELNDEFTRAQFRNLVIPFLRDIQSRRGITNFEVVCDQTNNTPQVIDTNGFVGDIFVAPARSINFIRLNFVATRTGVEFNEIVGRV